MSVNIYSCDACRLDGTIQEAKFFCLECNDYMCFNCETYHQKVKATRLHNLMSVERNRDKVVPMPGIESEEVTGDKSTAAENVNFSGDDSTPAEEDYTWEPSVAEDCSSGIASYAEEYASHTGKSYRLFLDAAQAAYTSIEISHASDKYEPLVTGLAFAANGELLVADYNNKTLKLFDSSLKIKQILVCPGIPYDVAIINDRSAVVTFPLQRNVVQFVKLYPRLQLGKSIQMNNGCWGVDVYKDRIYIACNANGHREELVVLDISGKLQRVFDIAKIAEQFGDLKHIAVNGNGDKLYLTGTSQILCMGLDGKQVYKCSYSAFEGPRGIVIDNEDNALVCCHGSNKILTIKSDGKKGKTLLSSKEGIQDPKAITYRNKDCLLVVGGWKHSSLLVFKLS